MKTIEECKCAKNVLGSKCTCFPAYFCTECIWNYCSCP